MEVGSPTSSAGGSRRGRGDREEAARGSGGAVRARVCARVRTPQGVGALLLVGGAIFVGAVVAWRRRGDGKSAKNHHHDKEKEVLDGGVMENEQGKLDKSDENLSREDTEVEPSDLDRKKTEELYEIQEKVDEIVADELDSEPADKFDPSSSRECTVIIDDMGRGDIEKADQNSSKSGIEKKITPNVLVSCYSHSNLLERQKHCTWAPMFLSYSPPGALLLGRVAAPLTAQGTLFWALFVLGHDW